MMMVAALAAVTFVLLSSTARADMQYQTALIADLGQTLTLDATKLEAFKGLSLTSASWDFADDTTGDGLVVTHAYSLYQGVYDVSVTAKEGAGQPHTTDLPIIVGGSVPIVFPAAPYVAIYINNKPAGLFNLTSGQSDDNDYNTSSLFAGGKAFNITTSMPAGSFHSTLVFSYDDVDDDGIVDGTSINEGMLNLYYYDGGSWTAVQGATLDTAANTITATVDHFDYFAILAPQVSTTTTAPAASGGASTSGGSNGGGGGGGGAPVVTCIVNGVCDSGETHDACPGECPATTTTTSVPGQTNACKESWACGAWLTCDAGEQQRTCVDTNSCGTQDGRPAVAQACTSGESTAADNAGSPLVFDWSGIQAGSMASYALLVVAIAAAALAVFFVRRTGKRARNTAGAGARRGAAKWDLTEMVQKGRLKLVGSTKGAYYTLTHARERANATPN